MLTTEQVNDKTKIIDQLTTKEIVGLMNEEDKTVALAVEKILPDITTSIDCIYEALKKGGRLFYVGAGTSGRLGVLDASECPPTFRTPPELVHGIIAGGKGAMFLAVEGAEDNEVQGATDLKTADFCKEDVVVGIAASGRTPYVIGSLKYARSIGAKTIALSCNKNAEISKVADHRMEVVVGPEILTGSTRLKSATAHKMILNMLTTTTMIKLGKVYQNLMVDLNASNEKLMERARNIIMQITDVSYEEAHSTLQKTNWEVKPAIVMIESSVDFEQAKSCIEQAEGSVRKAIEYGKNKGANPC